MKDEYVNYLKKYLDKDKLEEGLSLLNSGISPQYIVGNVDFYGNTIFVDKRVLIPRYETELLVEKAIGYINKYFGDNIRILDIGTGSGCIAITVKKILGCEVVASDISRDAIDVASYNAKYNSVDIDFVCSDIFLNIEGKFDVIISNPPYIRKDENIEEIVRENEPNIALSAEEDGLYFYHKILEGSSKYLNDRYMIAFEIGEAQ